MGIKWLQVRDANTAYFHSWCQQQRNFNYVARIKYAMGNWLEAIDDIKRPTVEFFISFFI